jgi:RimJ/RimL family protein N-acetyltransferase
MIAHISRLADDETAFGWMQEAFRLGLMEGCWPPRDPPSGEEDCIFARTGPAQIIGAATFFHCGHNRGWIDLVYVSKSFRAKGVGRLLIEAAKAQMFSRGFEAVEFGTFSGNRAMQALGARTGFANSAVIMSASPPKGG